MRIAAAGALACLAILVVPARAAPRQANTTASSRTFESWTATCDNLRACVAIGSSEGEAGLFYARVARSAEAAAQAKIKLVLAAADPIPGAPGAFALSVKAGGTRDGFVVEAKRDDPEGAAIAGTVADTAFLTSIERGETLDFAAGKEKGSLALKGFVAALRFIDEQQGRAGTPTALVARGTTSFDQVPPMPPVVQPAAGLAATPVSSPILSRALLDMAKPACDPEVVEAHSDAAAWMLGADRRLVAVPCADSPYNVSAALFTTDAKGEQPRPAMLEQPPKQGDAEADNVVVNYDFDVKTLTLTSLDKGRALGDCGTTRTWVWTGEIFALLSAAELEACPGALPEDWPPVFAAVRK